MDTLKVAESPHAKVVKSKDIVGLYGLLNMRKRGGKLGDIRIRKALNYAINREELWKYAAKGNAWNLGGYIPEGGYGHNPNLNLYTYDTEKARSLLADAGYPDGFEVNLITYEALSLEAQIISKMLERVGLKVKMDVRTYADDFRKVYIPLLEKPPEEQEWDISLRNWQDYYGHTGASFLNFGFLEGSNIRWIAYDQTYEDMWQDMARTVDREEQEKKIQHLVEYIYDNAYLLFVYSPISLYAVNKEINFVPQKFPYIRLKESSVTDKHWSVRAQSE